MGKVVNQMKYKSDEIDDETLNKIKENYPRHYNPNIDYLNKLKMILYSND